MAVNGTSRAMQGSDCIRLRARDDKSWSADGEPETANSYFTAHRLDVQKCRVAVFIALIVLGYHFMQKGREERYFARESHTEHALKPCSTHRHVTPQTNF